LTFTKPRSWTKGVPGSFIKDAIEFYLAHLNQRGAPVIPQPQVTYVAQDDSQEVTDNLSTDDLFDF
jgi:hypothetical protein